MDRLNGDYWGAFEIAALSLQRA
jgi:hypothetical protein